MRTIYTFLSVLPVTTILSGVLLFSCEQKKQMQEMHENTGEMNQTTKGMNQKMGEMNTEMKGMGQTMGKMNGGLDSMSGTMTEMNGTMGEMNGGLKEIGTTMKEMNGTMGEMNGGLKEMGTTMKEMNGGLKKMDSTMVEMNSGLHGVDDKMGGLSKSIIEMDKKLAGLTSKMDEIYAGARPVLAEIPRDESLKALLTADTLERKISVAAKYFMAFEFQAWGGHGADNDEKRVELGTSAMKEFFREIHDFLPNSNHFEADPFSQDNRAMSFNALAVAMHSLFEVQENLLKTRPDLKPMSIFSMLIESLKGLTEIQAGRQTKEELPSYFTEVATNKPVALFLLQARVNMLVTMTLARISPLKEKWKSLPWGAIKTLYSPFGWEAHFSSLDISVLEMLKRYLTEALKVKNFMEKDLNLSFKLNPKLQGSLKKMRLSKMSKSVGSGSEDPITTTTSPTTSTPPSPVQSEAPMLIEEVIQLLEPFRN